MKPEDREQEEVRAALQRTFPAGETELRRDLWPSMLRRLEEQPGPTVPWYDWVLAGGVLAVAVFFPKIALLFAFHL
ncbi:MAG TPA: hypothetical protein VKE93_02830 [Candidatus Angelobacter sp.]|nr:hypothetical protein [Candidatus Angelobacter sp.]